MRKTSLLITSFALLVGGGLLCSASPITPNARKATIEDPSIYTYTKVESASDIVSGSQYIFTSEGTLTSDDVATGVNFMATPKNALTSGDNYFTSSTLITDALLVTIQSSTNGYTLTYTDDSEVLTYIAYNGSATSKSNYLHPLTSFNNYCEWNINVSTDSVSIQNIGNTSRYIQFNSGSPRFAGYTGTQKDPSLYRVDVQSTYTVTFHYGWDGTQNVTTKEVSVIDGKTVEVSSDIDTNVENYRFVGWYTSTEYTTEFDFEAGITGNTDIYAYYEATADYTIGDHFALNSTKSSMIASYQKSSINEEVTYPYISRNFQVDLQKGSEHAEENAKTLFGEECEGLSVLYEGTAQTNIRLWKDGSFRAYNNNQLTISTSSDCLIKSIDVDRTSGYSIDNGTISNHIEVNAQSIKFTFTGSVTFNTFSITYESKVDGYIPTDASIRFGANVSMDYYDETAKYGLILGNNLEDTTIKAKLNNEATAEEFATANGLVAIENKTVAFVDEEGTEVEQETATKYQFATVLTGMVTHLSDKVTAAAYMEYDGKLYLMDETTYSLKTLAQKYLDDQLVTDPDGIGLLEAIIAA